MGSKCPTVDWVTILGLSEIALGSRWEPSLKRKVLGG
jgi:hypothetical protein